jgi:hypothetical protein
MRCMDPDGGVTSQTMPKAALKGSMACWCTQVGAACVHPVCTSTVINLVPAWVIYASLLRCPLAPSLQTGTAIREGVVVFVVIEKSRLDPLPAPDWISGRESSCVTDRPEAHEVR